MRGPAQTGCMMHRAATKSKPGQSLQQWMLNQSLRKLVQIRRDTDDPPLTEFPAVPSDSRTYRESHAFGSSHASLDRRRAIDSNLVGGSGLITPKTAAFAGNQNRSSAPCTSSRRPAQTLWPHWSAVESRTRAGSSRRRRKARRPCCGATTGCTDGQGSSVALQAYQAPSEREWRARERFEEANERTDLSTTAHSRLRLAGLARLAP